ncbi:hypothetical protein Snoj_35870 [Streptomyces nojiriensis]|uniref:DUF4097 domain-containing protein n=1 Tax=Streptomyces nojiriensis TaxID=66374 RepID=A0ABQ3SNF7_9ACTN|nr:DUF4097 family beta strand repeat-containing protein [Streptomyces nojiriensis]QTI43225.1 hypothetical protein JYK04_00987 [Streptomyces nojiriensis]GHI69669.1 hypothetical protein Snoj_35870 [Streptomyces nojiriensis]
MQKFATTAPIATVLDVPAGLIRFIAADRADTTVEILPADASKDRDVKAAAQTTAAYADGVLRIAAAPAKNRILDHPGSVEITVQLPAGSRVEAKTAAAELHTTGRLGDVTFESAQGTVTLDETASAHLTLMAGDITVGRLGGPARITTQKGDLQIAEAQRGTVELTTQAGDITIGTARGVSATLDAGTAHGRIHNTLTNTDGATAGLNIRATTSYGDITARSI